MPRKFSIGQEIRIVDYDHAWCGEFGRVVSVTSGEQAAIVHLPIFDVLVPATVEQVLPF